MAKLYFSIYLNSTILMEMVDTAILAEQYVPVILSTASIDR